MQVRLNNSFRMHQRPSDLAFQRFVNTLYPQKAAVRYGVGGLGRLGQQNDDTTGPPPPGCTSVESIMPTPRDCSPYCSVDAGSGDCISCTGQNNNLSTAVSEIQTAYGGCIPVGSTMTVDASGNWSVSNPPIACPASDPNCRGTAPPIVGVVSAAQDAAIIAAYGPGGTEVSQDQPAALPYMSSAQSGGPSSVAPTATPAPSATPAATPAAAAVVPASAAAQQTVVTTPATTTGDWISGVPNWAVIGGGALVLVLLMGGRR